MTDHEIEVRGDIVITRFRGRCDPENAQKFVDMAVKKVRIPGRKVKILTDLR